MVVIREIDDELVEWKKEYQVESGEISQDLIKGDIMIFAEVFPSWLLILDNKIERDRKTYVYIQDEAVWFRRAMKTSFLHQVTNQWDVMTEWWDARNIKTSRTVFIQGSSRFIKEVVGNISRDIQLSERLVMVCSGRISSNLGVSELKWLRKRHSSFGGVTSTWFSIGTSKHFCLDKWITKDISNCHRSLLDIVKVDKGGAPCKAPSGSPVRKQIDVSAPISTRDLTSVLALPSVFSKDTGWVLRKLMVAEIALAMDFPPKVLTNVEINARLRPNIVKTMLSLPPVKVIQGCLNMIMLIDETKEKPIYVPKSLSPVKLSLSVCPPSVTTAIIAEGNLKSVKHDDAQTQSGLWDERAISYVGGLFSGVISRESIDNLSRAEAITIVFRFLRKRMLLRFKKNIVKSALRYMRITYGVDWKYKSYKSEAHSHLIKDLEGIKVALHYSSRSEFWEWKGGSYPFFWRWPKEIKEDMRDGTPLFIKGALPRYRKPQRVPRDPKVADMVASKLFATTSKGYIAEGHIISLSSYFHVPKGDDDIRMVYDLTACGLNEALWAPSFWMPNVKNVLDCATHASWFGDVDAAEMFLNYMLDLRLRSYAGVDISWLNKSVNPSGMKWGMWNRMPMGLLPSPWTTIRQFAWAMEVIKGDRRDPKNPFHWSEVILNCPGSRDYSPSMPRLYKWSDVWVAIAGDAKTFVDDLRSIGCSEEHCQLITHQVETRMGYLGLQDATRKRRPVSPSPGEWTGSIIRAVKGTGLFVTVSVKKWEKIKAILQEVRDSFTSGVHRPKFELKELERKVGFLVHVAMAYPIMFPFLKGFYLTMNSWRSGRDKNDWKLPAGAYQAYLAFTRGREVESSRDSRKAYEDESPREVVSSPELLQHVESLLELFSEAEPTLRLVRGTAVVEVVYVFGDASGSGFGSSWCGAEEKKTSWRFGVWGAESKDSSSNYRELRNLTETLEEMGIKGDLQGREVFLFTDNMVSEAIVAKGSSQNPILYQLVVRIVKLQMIYGCIVHFIHVAGTRMIDQGSDGLSRGDMYEGIMSGRSMFDFVPLHQSACSRFKDITNWVEGWARVMGNPIEVLSPEDWFERGHDIQGSTVNLDGVWLPSYKRGSFIWSPPPAVAGIIMDELRQARHKRQKSFHVFICPRLMYPEWRRGLYKSADMILEIRAGSCSFWPKQAHETLIVAILFPYLHRCPWELRKAPLLVGVGRKVSKLLASNEAAGSNLLSKFCAFTRRFDSLPILQLCRLLSGRSKFSVPSQPSIQ